MRREQAAEGFGRRSRRPGSDGYMAARFPSDDLPDQRIVGKQMALLAGAMNSCAWFF